MNFPKDLIKGNVKISERLSAHTSFRIGGPVGIWVEPKNTRELKKILTFAREENTPLFIIGSGSNILARDSGFDGIIVKLSSPYFKNIRISGTTVRVGAGHNTAALVRLCCSKGLGGLESLAGIPGTVGGAVFMNAGGWSSPLYKNIGDCVKSLKVMDNAGNIKIFDRDRIAFGYRTSGLSDYIILEAVLKLRRSDKITLTSTSSKFLKMKKARQVLDKPSAGCVFKNPEGSQFTTGQLIDMLGLKGLRVGGAEVSRKHANFIVNCKNASCEDVLKLINLIKTKVMDNYNIPLELEIKVI